MEQSNIYTSILHKLAFETALIVFIKKNGDIRLMLGTRNQGTIWINNGYQGQQIEGHDKRCNITNGNIAVFDLIAGEARSFNVDRLVEIKYLGEIDTTEQLEEAANKFNRFKEAYDEQLRKTSANNPAFDF